jgi:hypothetical protein
MRSFLTKGLLTCGILLLGNSVASAHWYPDDPYYGRGGYAYGNHGSYGLRLFDEVQAHLERAAYNAYGSRGRIERARKDVYDFQRRWNEGRFDRHELDEAIGSVQRVVDSNSIDQRDRYVLLNDLARMREFRASRGGYDRRRYDPYYGR